MALVEGSRDFEALFRTVVGEAVGEGTQGQIAVAWVIRNRVRDPRWPNTIHDVCHQPYQFECMTNSNLTALLNSPTAQEIRRWLPRVYET